MRKKLTKNKLKNVVITGANGDLATSIINLLEADNIILISRNIDNLLEKYANRENIYLYQCDIAKDKEVGLVCQDISRRFGAIDLLINNAGYGQFKNFMAFSYDEIKDMFTVNTLALMNITRRFLAGMKENNQGHIINISSMASKMATAQSSIYAASKFAVLGFSNALRLELAGNNIIVTTVNPGPIKTKFFDIADPSGEYLDKVSNLALDPDKLALKIVKNIGRKKREINAPRLMEFAARLYTIFPRTGDFLALKMFNYK